jgi:hypothetical protein
MTTFITFDRTTNEDIDTITFSCGIEKTKMYIMSMGFAPIKKGLYEHLDNRKVLGRLLE